jgi:lipoate-protein ligase A
MDRTWRLIVDGDLPAAMNMAIDEAILLEFLRGNVPPTLRLYGWKQPSISLGCFQSLDSGRLDLKYCEEQGIQLVRRSTGGRAVIHGHDLTFSIVVGLPGLPPESRGVVSSHTLLMGGIVEGLQAIGIPAVIGPESRRHPEKTVGADCFSHIAECDVRVGRAKIAGAAQVRRGNGLMEQGSLPCRESEIDPTRIFPSQHHASPPLPDVLVKTSLRDIQAAIISGFQRSLGIEFACQSLTDAEKADATELEKSRYHNSNWTYAHEHSAH